MAGIVRIPSDVRVLAGEAGLGSLRTPSCASNMEAALAQVRSDMWMLAGAAGFEPVNAGTKNRAPALFFRIQTTRSLRIPQISHCNMRVVDERRGDCPSK